MQGVCCAPCRSLRTALKGRSVVYAYNEFYRLEMQYFLLFEYFYAITRNDTERRAQLPTVGRSIPSAAGARVPKKRRAACDSSRNVAFFRTVSACIESNHCKLPDHRLALFRVDENAPVKRNIPVIIAHRGRTYGGRPSRSPPEARAAAGAAACEHGSPTRALARAFPGADVSCRLSRRLQPGCPARRS